MQITPITGIFGAEVCGIDLARLDAAGFGALQDAMLEYGVLAIRDQALTPASQLAFARRFGEVHYHPHVSGLPEQPEVMEILKTEADRQNFGSGWHTDQMFLAAPAAYTCLYGIEIPATGGDTAFACMANGYRTLSPAMQRLAADVRTLNRSVAAQMAGRSASAAATFSNMRAKDAPADEALAEHPVVRRHPETGEPVLYVGLHTVGLAGFTEAEARPLIDFWMQHLTRTENTLRLRWRPGTLAIWDNRRVLHNAMNDYQGQRRRMHRITIAGDATVAYRAAA